MTSDPQDEGIALALDRLGAESVAEVGEVPSLASSGSTPRPRRVSSRWLVAAALVAVAGLGTALFLSTGDDPGDEVVADRIDEAPPAPRPAPTETERAEVTVEFRRDPDRRDLAFIGGVTNHSDQPWSWDCLQGELSRWDGDEWAPVAPSAIWGQGLLALQDSVTTLDCGPATDFLAPGATVDRSMQPVWWDDDSGAGTRPLATPGDYRLVTEGRDGIVAVGRFTIDEAAARSSTAVATYDLSGGLALRDDRPPADDEIAGPDGTTGLVQRGGWPVRIERAVGVDGGRRLGLVLRSNCNQPPARLTVDRVDGSARLSVTATQFATIDCVGEPDTWSVVVDVDAPMPRRLELVGSDGNVEIVELDPAGTDERTVVLASTDGRVDVPRELTPLAAQFWQPWGTGAPGYVDSFRTGDLCTSAATVIRFTVGESSVDGVSASATLPARSADMLTGSCPLPLPLPLRPAD